MICTNCGADRQGPFCGHCGQNDRNYQRALPPLLSELLRETFELDSRAIRTLHTLLFRPGELAVEFSRNRRASYVSPIRLYLMISITFFFLLSVSADIDPLASEGPTVTMELEAVANTDTDWLLRQLGPNRIQRANEILDRPDTSVARLLLLQLARSVQVNQQDLEEVEVYMIGQIIDALHEPGSALDQLLDNLPIAIFIMLPVYALLLKIFYFRSHRYYVENLVFATHLHSFAFIVFALLLLLPEEMGIEAVDRILDWLATLLWLTIGLYHYLALKRYYGNRHLGTLVRFSGLMLLYSSLLMPTAFIAVVLITVAT